MLNQDVKVGMPVTFKHSGQTHSGVVKSVSGGPEPDGAVVVVDKIAPSIQGQPNVTVDAVDLTAGKKVPTGPPFSVPAGATFDGGEVPTADSELFSGTDAASGLLPQYTAAAGGPLPTTTRKMKRFLARTKDGATVAVTIKTPFTSVNGIESGAYPQFTCPAPFGIFLIQGVVEDDAGKSYVVNDVAGEMIYRTEFPDPDEGDSNYIQEGHGADAKDVPVPGKISLILLPEEGLAEACWVKK
jgi:hypothetical protein